MIRTIRRALLDGALIVLPLGGIVLLVLGIIRRLRDAADPLSGQFLHPALSAVLLLVLLCLVIGFLVRSAPGYRARRVLEAVLLEKVPGFRLVQAYLGDGPLAQHAGRAMRPAMAAIEEGLCPALVMDELTDGRLVVFVPGSPAPMSGAVYVFTPDKVTLLDVPLLPFLRAVSSWGVGLAEILEGRHRRDAQQAP